MAKSPAKPEGKATPAQVIVQADLADRTYERLAAYANEDGLGLEAIDILREAFREAHCDHTLNNIRFWDLGGNARIITPDGTTIPCEALPPVGTILQWNGQTYYIASHEKPKA